jgi:hypothetical protein
LLIGFGTNEEKWGHGVQCGPFAAFCLFNIGHFEIRQFKLRHYRWTAHRSKKAPSWAMVKTQLGPGLTPPAIRRAGREGTDAVVAWMERHAGYRTHNRSTSLEAPSLGL